MKLELSFNLVGRALRKRIDPKKMCAQCTSEHTWQTKDGQLLCERCYSLYLKRLKR